MAVEGLQGVRGVRVAWVPLILLTIIVLAAIFAPLLTNFSPNAVALGERLKGPGFISKQGFTHLLGTDQLGRDVLTRLLYGGRTSLIIGGIVLAIGGAVGLVAGVVAGYFRGIVDIVISRAIDSFLGLPLLLLAIVFAMTFGASLTTEVIALSLLLWSRIARVIRGDVLALADSEYVLQARIAGVSSFRIMVRHIVPNVANTFVVLLALNLAWVIVVESSLSFLGAGIPPPTPSWGSMIADGRSYITSAWWLSMFPGLMLALLVLCVNLLGDWLRDGLDPRLNQL